jgi:hypothetical protein
VGEEADKLDETWCLYDGQLIDDELYRARPPPGLRILVLSDSCGGSIVRAGPPLLRRSARIRSKMPPSVAMRTPRRTRVLRQAADGRGQDVGNAKVEPTNAGVFLVTRRGHRPFHPRV